MQSQKIPFWDWADVYQAAIGNWEFIFQQLAPETADAWVRPGKHVTCPIHGTSKKRGDGFRVYPDSAANGNVVCNTCGKYTGIKFLMHLNHWEFKDAVQEIALVLGIEPSKYYYAKRNTSPKKVANPNPSAAAQAAERQQAYQQQQAVAKENQVKRDLQAQKYINNLWDNARPLTPTRSDAASKYLSQRGITIGVEPELRTSVIPYFENKIKVGEYQALLAAVRSIDGELLNVHRTYLTNDGHKADLSANKKLCYSGRNICQAGGCVRLGAEVELSLDAEDIVFVCEGTETALSVATHYKQKHNVDIAVWAALSATFMPHIEVPESCHTIIVFGDNDESGAGINAAAKLCAAHAGIRNVISFVPKVMGEDWNDVLNNGGKFPDWEFIMTQVYD